jgi:hypothetical protein
VRACVRARTLTLALGADTHTHTHTHTLYTRRPEMRFDVLVREGMHQQATGILVAAARDNAQMAHEALRKGLEGLGPSVVAQASEQSAGLMKSLMPWLEQLVPSCETIDPAMEVPTYIHAYIRMKFLCGSQVCAR